MKEVEQECKDRVEALIERGYLDPLRRQEAIKKLLENRMLEGWVEDPRFEDPDTAPQILHRW